MFLRDTYSLEVLEDIEDFPLSNDTQLADYYEKISEKVSQPSNNSTNANYNERYYIQKIKPFFLIPFPSRSKDNYGKEKEKTR